MGECDIGLTGLAVMGQNLALNMAGRGFKVAVHNRTEEKARSFMAERAEGLPLEHGPSLKDFTALLKKPRNMVVMVKAGQAVDDVIRELEPLLEAGDLLMDCGNSHFKNTERRGRELSGKGVMYMGVGVSGGEWGALHGPSIMPGGSREAYERMRPVFESIAAKTPEGPCVTYLGPGGAGHYVKMVHNGIEYGDMQLIAETYDVLKRTGGMDPAALSKVFDEYQKGELSSYLVEITAAIFKEEDPESGLPLIDQILDRAGQKGTGSWTAMNALELKAPVPAITAAVDARNMSAMKDERAEAEKVLAGPSGRWDQPDEGSLIDIARSALYAARISLYAQGFSLLKKASLEYDFDLDLGEICRIWKGGCIIRSKLLDLVQEAVERGPSLPNLLVAPGAAKRMADAQDDLRELAGLAAAHGVPVPAHFACLAYYDFYRSGRVPANLIQAQRDYFGAHTFERIHREGKLHHKWGTTKSEPET